jgi:hypothetical protein
LEAQLGSLREQFSAIRKDADAVVAGLDDEQLRWRPAMGVWSIIDCLAHLNVVNRQDLNPLFQVIQKGKAEGVVGTGPFKWKAWERWFIYSVEPPFRMKVKAPKVYVPPPDPEVQETLLEFQQIHNDLDYLVRDADGLDLAKLRVTSPVSKWIKMSLGARLDLMAAHDRRHLWQARRVRELAGFPKK